MRFGVGRGDKKTGGKEAKFNSGSVIDAIITDEIVVVVQLLTALLFFWSVSRSLSPPQSHSRSTAAAVRVSLLGSYHT